MTERYPMEYTECPECGSRANNSVTRPTEWFCPYCRTYFGSREPAELELG